MVMNHFVHNGKSQPCSIGFSEADERIKQRIANGRRHSRPTIDNAYLELTRERSNIDYSFTLRLCRRFARIQDEIKESPFDFLRIKRA